MDLFVDWFVIDLFSSTDILQKCSDWNCYTCSEVSLTGSFIS